MCSLSILAFAGCSDTEVTRQDAAPPVLRADASTEPDVVLPSELRRKLRANEKANFPKEGNDIVGAELFQSGVKSIEALRGLPLRFLDLGMTEVTDLSPIEGMQLKTLILENTPVNDLSAIKGMQLEVLHLQNTKIKDLSLIQGMPIRELNLLSAPVDDLTEIAKLPLETLWVPLTQVTDISPLQGKPMISLDVRGTKVDTLAALTGMTTLKRLNIADTLVSDLTPLQGMKLERITLSPQNIKTGIEVIRAMSSLNFIPTSEENPQQSAAEFWRMYDAGFWNVKQEAPATTPADTKEAEAKFEKLLNDSGEKDSPKTDSQPETDEQAASKDADKEGEKNKNEDAPGKSVEIK